MEFSLNEDLLRRLVMEPGVSGYEEPIRRLIGSEIDGLGEAWVDDVGNLFLDLGGEGDTVLIAAHMDELGLVITSIFDDGLLAFRKLGGIDDRVLPSQHVVVLGSKGPVEGVIGLEPPHLQLEKEPKVVPWHQLRIDVGASSREEVEELGIRVLDPVVPKKHWTRLAGGRFFASRGFDDRAGVYVLVELARLVARGSVRPRHHVVLAWTVQEELGLRGALAIAARLKPKYFIAVDTMACCRPEITGPARPGNGPVIRALDNAYVADWGLVRRAKEVAEEEGIPYQLASAGGGTDAAAFMRAGVRSVAIVMPVKYGHTTVETIARSDIEDTVKLLAKLLEKGLVE
ncbi:M20/M25/M40 family metallo-hydrolase [Pyrofollis japonicus]|uniref:M42 family metallopeptidase n=1 Tax=Pyrofollis japonicus TaxID=3060460 RepID=UPI00295B27FA|nr:M20/M25/M40 family metallo-hydrolase [Pyrofollis japonicus]BEP17935.1 M20/M25/M40 family metallo-hydrolase [Pyrofollis japonicus]